MKLTFRQIDPFIKSPDPAARVILVYGPDDGLMRARAKSMGQLIIADFNDPFNAVTLKSAQIADDPALLRDEASAMSMMGGARLIRIEDGTDSLVPTLKAYLESPSTENLVIIEAGNLGTGSKLRSLCERAKNAAAVPCYIADAKDLGAIIRNNLSADGYSASPDAMAWLSEDLAGDHARVMTELEKLKTYMGAQKRIELCDVQAVCGSGGALVMDDFIYALAGKQSAQMLKAYTQLCDEGIPVIAMIRALQNHFRRLHITHARMKDGASQDAALGQLYPQVFFKFKPAFQAQLSRWSLPLIATALARLSDLEARCKQTGTPVETVSAQAFLSLSRGR